MGPASVVFLLSPDDLDASFRDHGQAGFQRTLDAMDCHRCFSGGKRSDRFFWRCIRQNDQVYAACVGGAISEEEYLAGLRGAGLIHVEVRNRFIYEASQIKAFFETEEIPGLKEMIDDLSAQDRENQINQMTMGAVGNVWSAEFYAQKNRR